MDAVHERRRERWYRADARDEGWPSAGRGRRAVDGVRLALRPRDALSVRPKLGGGGVGSLILSRKR